MVTTYRLETIEVLVSTKFIFGKDPERDTHRLQVKNQRNLSVKDHHEDTIIISHPIKTRRLSFICSRWIGIYRVNTYILIQIVIKAKKFRFLSKRVGHLSDASPPRNVGPAREEVLPAIETTPLTYCKGRFPSC